MKILLNCIFSMTAVAVIFDMDGVLVDSNKYILFSFNQILNRYGIHIADDELKDYLGLSIIDIVKIWKEKHGVDFDAHKFVTEANNVQLELMKETLKVNNKIGRAHV